jgi:hypothetical protein
MKFTQLHYRKRGFVRNRKSTQRVFDPNPYMHHDGTPAVRVSYCAYLDLLGFTEETQLAYKNGTENELFTRLCGALAKVSNLVAAHAPVDMNDGKYSWHHKFFTDNLLLGNPVDACDDEGECDLNVMFVKVQAYQTSMALAGFFMRGGMSHGKLHVGDDVVFGEALLVAVHDMSYHFLDDSVKQVA